MRQSGRALGRWRGMADGALVAVGAGIALAAGVVGVMATGSLGDQGIRSGDAVSVGTFIEFPSPRSPVLQLPEREQASVAPSRSGPVDRAGAAVDRATAPRSQVSQAPSRGSVDGTKPIPQTAPPRDQPAPAPPRKVDPHEPPRLFDIPDVEPDPPGYRRLVDAAEKGDPTAAIVLIEDYRTQTANRHADRLAPLIETALDRLWWQRIGELLAERQRVMARIGQLRQDQARNTDPKRQQAIVAELQRLQAEADEHTRELQDMRYTASSPPDLKNQQAMQRLRDQRDAMTYGFWRERTMRAIIRTRGLAPWMVK